MTTLAADEISACTLGLLVIVLLCVVTVLLISILLFGEHLGARQIAGALLIVAGIVVLAVSEPDSTPDRTTSLAQSRAPGGS